MDYAIPQATTANPAMDYAIPQAENTKYMSMGPAPGDELDELEENEENYTSMHHYQQPDPASNDGGYAILKDMRSPENLIKCLDVQSGPTQRPPRTQSESELDRLYSNADYAVPYQNRKASKDDASLGRGAKGTPSGNANPPDIPDRLDLQENKLITAGTAERDPFSSPYATTPRKKPPIPTPRRNLKLRPNSAGSLDRDTNMNNGEEQPPRCSSQSIASSDTQGVAHMPANKKMPPDPPLPYQPTKHAPDVQQELGEYVHLHTEMHTEDRDGDDKQLPVVDQNQTLGSSEQLTKNKHYITFRPNGERTVQPIPYQDFHGQEMLGESQTPAPPGRQIPGGVNNGDSSPLIEGPCYENADVMKRLSADVIDLSFNHEDPDPDPIYDKPLTLPLPPDIPPEVLNQPPPLPDKLFGGTMRRNMDTSHQHFVGDWALPTEPVNPFVQSVNPVVQPVNPVFQPVNPFVQSVNPVVQPVNPVVQPFNPVFPPVNPVFQPVNPVVQPVNPVFPPVNPVFQPVNPAVQPVNPASQPVNLGGATNEGAYDAGIQEIRQMCGEEVARDLCYAALLQYEGDIERAVCVIKIQKLSNLTGKSEQFCERTLSHCTWDLDRAAGYIFENFEDKDV